MSHLFSKKIPFGQSWDLKLRGVKNLFDYRQAEFRD